MTTIIQFLPGYVTDSPNAFFNTSPFVGRGAFSVLFTPSVWSNSLGLLLAEVLLLATIVAGLIFFGKLLMAGFSYLTSAGDSNKIQAATKEITNATIGLLIVISTFFLAQIIEVILKIKITIP